MVLPRVDEVRPVVARDPDLLFRFAFEHIVSRARSPLLVFDSQHDVDEDGTTQETNNEVGEDGSMAGPVAGLFTAEEDIR